MRHHIFASDPFSAWIQSYKYLMSQPKKETFGLTVDIFHAGTWDEKWMDKFNARKWDKKFPSIYQDADVIFPDWKVRKKETLEDFFEYEIKRYKTATHKPFCDFPNWGNYFLRLTESKYTKTNSVWNCIKSLKTWGKQCRSVFTFHITSIDHDKIQPQGNCCLQYLELIQDEPGQLSICCAYRAHDYFVKALGNWIGISRLLTFICHHTGFKPGGILCMDGRAYISGRPAAQNKMLEIANKIQGE